MDTHIINLYPLFKFIIILFAIVGLFDAIKTIANLISRAFKDKLDNKKDIHTKDCDTDVMQDLIMKYPNVQKEFMLLPEREQNIENNQEIHEINKKLLVIQKDLDEIRRIQNGGLWYTYNHNNINIECNGRGFR